jgi:mono/diheme cytochrome c family protein
VPGRAIAITTAAFVATLVAAAAAADKADLARGWSTLRAMDCARCHGRDFDGWSAPSLIVSVRESTRERFDRYVLDGDIARGMPGYRSQPAVPANLDAIYAYLLARAKGEIGPGNPDRAAQPLK